MPEKASADEDNGKVRWDRKEMNPLPLEMYVAEFPCEWQCRIEVELTDDFHPRYTRTGMLRVVDKAHANVHRGVPVKHSCITIANNRKEKN